MALVKLNDSTVVKIIDPSTEEVALDSKKKEMFVEVVSADSKKYRKTLANIVKDNESKKATKKNNDDLMTDILAHSIISWNIETDEGSIPFTIENAVYVLETYRYIRDALLETVNDRKIFLQK